MGDSVWVRYKNYPEFYGATVKHIHHCGTKQFPDQCLYDVLYLDGLMEMGVHSTQLKQNNQVVQQKHHYHEQHHHAGFDSFVVPTAGISKEEIEADKEEDVNQLFRDALQHTAWGRTFRIQWDAETSHVDEPENGGVAGSETSGCNGTNSNEHLMIGSSVRFVSIKDKKIQRSIHQGVVTKIDGNSITINYENQKLQQILTTVVQRTDIQGQQEEHVSYSYLDQLFHSKNPPIGRKKRFWIVPKSIKKPFVYSDDDDAKDEKNSEPIEYNSGTNAETMAAVVRPLAESNGGSSPGSSSNFGGPCGGLGGGMGLGSGSLLNRFEIVAFKDVAVEESDCSNNGFIDRERREPIGGVPLRCDMVSSRMHQFFINQERKKLPKPQASWLDSRRGVMKRQRNITTPKHSAPQHSARCTY